MKMSRVTQASSAIATLFAIALLPSQSGAQEQLTIAHAQGETVVPANPEKIVVFDLGVLDTLDALGAAVVGVPAFAMPAYLAEYEAEDIGTVGSLFEPDYEAVNLLDPDLIVVALRSASSYEQLSAIAPTIDLTTGDDYLGGVIGNVRTLGEITGASDTAETLIADFEASVADLRTIAADAGNALVVMVSGGAITAYGPGSRFGWVHDDLGITPAIEDIEAATHGDAISFEFLLETNPDWLIVIDRDAAIGEEGLSAAEVLDNEIMAETTAWQNGHVIYADAAAWYLAGGGIQGMQTTVDQLADALGGE